MNYPDNKHVVPVGLLFIGVLHDVKKSPKALQPIFEAFTNALEAIKIRRELEPTVNGEISIKIDTIERTDENVDFHSITIKDNGIGFNDKEFERFNTFKDFTKGYNNLGSGRIQYAHYFDNTVVKSIYRRDNKYFEREFIISKSESFLDKNALVFHRFNKETTNPNIGTSISFNNLLENSNVYNELNHETLKEALIERYMHYFCYNKLSLPSIKITFHVQGELKNESTISQFDIPKIDKTDVLSIKYSKISRNGKSIESSENSEDFRIDAFIIPKNQLKSNNLKLVSKGEIVENSPIELRGLSANDSINGLRYLFLISSNYIDSRDTNLRGNLNIPTTESFAKNTNIFTPEEILLENIEQGINNKIIKMYPAIDEIRNRHEQQLKKLKEMFLLDDEATSTLDISVNDSENKILEKFYEAEAKKTANIDATIKESIDRLNALDTTSDKYPEHLEYEINKLVKVIPLQNKTTLTHYVARRKLILELFDKILKKQLAIQNSTLRSIDERLLHNLIFQQSSKNPENSDLWLVNEDFIYFKGSSESLLKDIKIGGTPIIRDNLTEDEETYRRSLGEDRLGKRPDILLFPDEGKCIILEFKNPDVNVTDHLTQINNYAALIWNFAKPEFKFHTFYGYLIGQKINPIDVRTHDGDFKEAYHFDYLFRPNKLVPGIFVSGDASLYTEVIKYTTLLERASRRNEIFIKKLMTKN